MEEEGEMPPSALPPPALGRRAPRAPSHSCCSDAGVPPTLFPEIAAP